MKRFLATFACVLLLLYVAMLFGGFVLLDVQAHPYAAMVAAALVISAVLNAFAWAEGKIDRLEKRVEALEKQLEQRL